jgi:hypothetical protein
MSYPDPDHNDSSPDDDAAFELAFSRANLPGLFLIVVGALNLFVGSLLIVRGFQFKDMDARELLEELKRSANQDLPQQDLDPETMKTLFLWLSFGAGPVIVLASLVTITGGMYMRTLRSYRLAVTAAALAAVPAVSFMACCGVGEVVGIWALVVLLKPEVKSAFF